MEDLVKKGSLLTKQIPLGILSAEVKTMTQTDIKRYIKMGLRGGLTLAAPLFTHKSTLDLNTARETLLAATPRPAGICKAANKLLAPSCDLQIIIPAYNVERYLEGCMASVLSQETNYTYHVILVDDGAKDRTPEIADKYANHPNVTVIHQANRGLSGARNTGLREIFGRYLLFIDSDDVLCPGAIDALLDTAYTHDCDLVEGGAYYVFDERQTVMHQYSAEKEIPNPFDLHGHAWGKLYKAEIFETLCFPEGFWYEDSLLSYLIFPAAKTVYGCPHICYGYRINQEGIVKSSQGKPKAIDTYWITEQLLAEHAEAGLSMDNAFFSYMLLQVRLNQDRVKGLSPEIQESVFVVTCDLMERYFPIFPALPGEKTLCKALKTRDFGMFRMCCKIFY